MQPDAAPWLLVSAAFVKTGGQDRANYALASYLAKRQTPVHLVAHSVGRELAATRGVVAHPAMRPRGSDLLGEPFLQYGGRWWARRLPPGTRVLVNGGNCRWPDVNWVHYVHAAYDRTSEGGVRRRAWMRLAHAHWLADERRALHAARIVIANSERTKRDLVERVGVDPSRIRVIYYGIDATQFRPPIDDERAAVRQTLGWPETRPVVLFIGALGDRRKGLDVVIDAWRLLAARTATDPLLVVIGRGSLLPEWRRRVAHAGLDASVAFLGFRTDVPALVRAADMLVAPTRYEAYGLGVHEALCCGLPAIVSADAGVAEQYPVALHDLLLPDPDDAADLAERLERAIVRQSARTAHMAAFAERLRARSWDDMAADIDAAATP